VPNKVLRPREYLTPEEIERLMRAARMRGRYGSRDAAMILIAYRHGLLAGELVPLRWSQIDLGRGLLQLNQRHRGAVIAHPLHESELRLLQPLRRETGYRLHVFMNERGDPMSAAGFRKLLSRIGMAAALGFPVHPYMLRHACAYKLAADGHDARSIPGSPA
jgi:type 1 fimbriae regulatory protein FimB/type 1 fimbriae regulatory protein FimE